MDAYELLTRELGADRVIRSAEALDVYARDESGRGVFPPDAAVLCDSRAEIELVLRLAAEHKIPVTPRGTGTGMTGGALPVRGGLVLSTERMKRIIDISVDDRIAIVEPGVINADLQAAVESQSMFYAPDPASLAAAADHKPRVLARPEPVRSRPTQGSRASEPCAPWVPCGSLSG